MFSNYFEMVNIRPSMRYRKQEYKHKNRLPLLEYSVLFDR